MPESSAVSDAFDQYLQSVREKMRGERVINQRIRKQIEDQEFPCDLEITPEEPPAEPAYDPADLEIS